MIYKKETIGYVVAIVALIGCCLLLPTIIAGGGLALIGVSLKKNWLVVVGIFVLFLGAIAFIFKRAKKK